MKDLKINQRMKVNQINHEAIGTDYNLDYYSNSQS